MTVSIRELREEIIEKAHQGNGTGCRCCAVVDDGSLLALLEAVEAAERLPWCPFCDAVPEHDEIHDPTCPLACFRFDTEDSQ